MNTTTQTTETASATVHPFQAAGLGLAPFRFIGIVKQDITHGEVRVGTIDGYTVTTKKGGTCAYCGTYIVQMCNVKSADGKRFHVGSDCIAKVGGEELARKVAKAVNAARAVVTKDRAAGKVASLVEILTRSEVRAALSAQPHPVAFRAARGETLLDSIEWTMQNAGTAGKLRAAKIVASVIA